MRIHVIFQDILNATLDLDSVPRVGDQVHFTGEIETFTVVKVKWCLPKSNYGGIPYVNVYVEPA